MSRITKTTLAETWSRCSSLPMGNQVFSFLLGRMARYTGTIGATVIELADGHSVVQMRDRPLVRNHLRSVHAIALMNLGEVSTGIAVMHQIDGKGRGIVTGLSMEYIKKARGTITATCNTDVPTQVGAHDLLVEGVLTDDEGDVVARCKANWKLDIQA